MSSRDRILINLFTSRIRKDQSTIDEVPDHLKERVQQKIDSMDPYEPREGETPDPEYVPIESGFSESGPLIGNVQSKVFHAHDCNFLPADHNQKEINCFASLEEAIEAGFRPCRNCNPDK